jgi:hypothetical protein
MVRQIITTMTEEYLSPEYRESLRERADRHEAHQAMLESHKQRKTKAREEHRKSHGRAFVYGGNLF